MEGGRICVMNTFLCSCEGRGSMSAQTAQHQWGPATVSSSPEECPHFASEMHILVLSMQPPVHTNMLILVFLSL